MNRRCKQPTTITKAAIVVSLGVLLMLGTSPKAVAQNTRLNDYNTIAWLTNTTTLRFSERWSGHLEYQLRRDEFLRAGQQNLFRTGINFHPNKAVTVRVGYAYVDTFPYGDYPIQAAGRMFPEHRIYQMVQLNNPVGRLEVSHRFMLEQRWIGRYLSPESRGPDETFFVNRVRYMARAQWPLRRVEPTAATPYVAAYDEVFVGFGRNVNANVFDQNRLALLVGYRFSPAFRIEGGYFQQIVQLPREIQNRSVFQYNSGLIVNTALTLDWRKQAE